MASDTSSDSRAAPAREPRRANHPAAPSQQGGPPNLGSGLEVPRSSDC